jgi:predicted MFS family arabinose efflux permease
MFTNPFHHLLAVSSCLRFADQLVVAGVPLVAAAVFKLPEDQVGAMIAAQGSAWLLMSMPAGVMIDRIAPLRGVWRASVTSFLGLCLLIAGLLLDWPILFTFGAFLSATAAVLGLLSDGASAQRLLKPSELSQGNARLQIIQSCAMLTGPLVMGLFIARGMTLHAFFLAALLTIVGLVLAYRFPTQEPPPSRDRNPKAEIFEGFSFVRQQPLLRGIVICAIFWNLAFMALAAVFVPYALRQLTMGAQEVGMAQAAMGVGSLAAAFTAGWALKNMPPRFILFFGPASSTVGAALLLIATPSIGLILSSITYLLLGFGPILWFICQNTIRQLVTPQGMLGRVGAVIQIALYGVRSIGALLAGKIAVIYGTDVTLWLIVGLFALSTLAIPLSALGGLSAMPRSVSSPA